MVENVLQPLHGCTQIDALIDALRN